MMKRNYILSVWLLCLGCVSLVKGQNISTIAGIGTASFSGDGGLAIAAELANPVSVAKDASGNIYIADQGNHRIRKIVAATGNIITVAGTTTSGYSGDGGLATAAKLYYPAGIALDASGNIYIADKSNQRIRKITAATGIITTIAGTGTAGFSGDSAAATSAKLDNPSAVTLDASGNIYISDQYNQRIRKITVATGNISTVAGKGSYGYSGDGGLATAAELANPAGLRVDGSGNIYIADVFNHVIRKVTATTGNISTIAGNGTSGFSGDGAAATLARLQYPSDVSLDDSGNIYIAAQYSHRVRKVAAATGNISTIAGTGVAGYSGDGGPAVLAALYYPTGIHADASGNIYVADRENHRIRFICNWTVLPVVSGPVSYCQGAPATALTATGASLKWWTVRSGGTGSATAPTPATATPGTTVYYVSTTSPSGCDGPRDSIQVTVNPLPAAPTVTAAVAYCVGAAATALTATGTGLRWYTTATGGSALPGAPVPTTTAAGVTAYYVSQTNTVTGCESPRSAITVTVSGLPVAPGVVSPLNYCLGGPAAALTATGSGLLWYAAATGGSGSASAPVPATTVAGSTTYYVSQTSAAGCGESPRAAIVVNVTDLPAPPAVTSSVIYCVGVPAAALSAVGTGIKWYTSATGGSGLTTAPVPSTSVAGITKYYVTQTGTSGCESRRDSITVIVNAAPAAPVVSSPLNYCIGAAATALTASGSSLKWYTVATGGSATAIAPVPATGTAGTTTWYVSSTNADGCEGPRSAIAVVVSDIPAAPSVTSPVNYCMGTPATALTAGGSALKWYPSATGGTGSATAPVPVTTATGTITYYVSQTTSCGESPRAAIIVNVNPVPAPPAVVSPLTYCQGSTTATALTATGTGLKWYATLTGGSGSATAPVPSTTTAGTFTYYVSQTVTGCESSRSAITVKINPAPPPPVVVTPVSYCVGIPAATLSAIGTGLRWYTTATGGTGAASPPTPSTAVAGTTVYYVSQTIDTSGCEGIRAAITVIVSDIPAAPGVSSPVLYCTGDATSALSATGTSLKWYAAATGGSGAAIAPVPSSAIAGNTSYYVSQTSSCGESPRAAIMVTVNSRPSVPVVLPTVTYCIGAAATPLSATGTSVKWYATATGGTGSTTIPVPATTVAGVYKYYASQTNASGCEGPRDSITVTVNTAPAAPLVSSPVNYCAGTPASPLTATGTGLLWYTTASGGTASTVAPVPSTLAAGTTTYYVSQTIGCESARAAITVNVYSAPDAPVVTSPVNYCVGAAATALTATGTLLKWYTTASGGTGTSSAPVPATLVAGTTTYYVSQSIAGGCGESARAAILVSINDLPAAPVVGIDSYSYCAGTPATPLSATGTSLKWYTTATGGTGTASAPVPSTLVAGTTIYYVSQTNASDCEGPRAAIKVRVNSTPAAPLATSPVEYCADAPSVPLTATGSNLAWYTVATGGSGSATAPTPLTSSTGATTWYVSQSSAGGCESPRTAVNVIVYATPSAPTVGFIVTVCIGGTPMPLSATGSGLKWYSSATGGTGSTTAPAPPTTTAGSTLYYVSQTSSSGCESPRAAIRVNVDTLLPPPAVVTPLSYCQGTPAAALVATGRALRWYTTKGGTASTTAPVPGTGVAGIFTYYVSQTSASGCESPLDSIRVTINPTPLAPAVLSPVSYCLGAAAVPLSATGTTLQWYTVATGGIAATTAPVPSTATAGFSTWYVSQSSPLGCESPRAAIAVTVNALPAAPAVVSPIAYCAGVPASALTASGTALKWYTTATGSVGSTTAPVPNTASAGSTTWYVSQTVGCESDRSALTVVVNALPLAPSVVTPVTYCTGAPTVALTASGTSLKWYTAATGGTALPGAPTPSSAAAGTTDYYVRQTNSNGCESPRAALSVVINALPAAPVVVSPIGYCIGTPASALTATGTGLKWYTVSTGGTATTVAPVPVTTVAGTTPYYVSQTNSNGCESPRSLIIVNVNALPSAPDVVSPVAYCVGATATALTATGTALKWYTSLGGTATTTAPIPVTTTAGSFIYYVSQTTSGGCEGPKATITVTVNTLPAMPAVVTPVAYCAGIGAVALTATGTGLKWYTTASGGTGSASAPVPVTTTPGIFTYYVTQSNAPGCESPRASIEVQVNALPAAPEVVSPTGYCVGATAVPLTATGTRLKWYTVATGGTGTATAPTPVTATASTTFYYVSSTSAEGCEGPRSAIEVQITNIPGVTITPLGAPLFVYCKNDSVTLEANSTVAVSYQWYRNTVLLPGATGRHYKAFNSADYTVVIKNGIGCEGTATVKVFADTLALPELSPTSLKFCPNVNVVLYAKPAAAGYTYEWMKDGVFVPGTTAASLVINKAGVYKVRVTDIYGCVSITNESIASTYPPIAKPVITRVDPLLRVASTYRSYQWFRNGKPIVGAVTSSYSMPFGGRYHVEVTDANDCMAQSDTVDTDKLAIDQSVVPGGGVRLYPNPTNGKVLIDAAVRTDVRVTDVTGRLILDLKDVKGTDLGVYADGIYVFTVRDQEGNILLIEKVNKQSQGQ